MKIIIEPTNEFSELGRLWRGKTESGHDCIVFVAAIGTPAGNAQNPALQAELADIGCVSVRSVTVQGSATALRIHNQRTKN